MERSGKTGWNRTARTVATVVALMAVFACSSRFKPGDPIGQPPLPPYDNIVGFFSKMKIADGTGDTYKLRDLPPSLRLDAPVTWDPDIYKAFQPSVVGYQGDLLLFFVMNEFDVANGITSSVKAGKLEPASPYIDTGANGISESGLGHDDVQVTVVDTTALTSDAVVVGPGIDGDLQTIVPRLADDVIVDAVVPGVNGLIDTVPVGDDYIQGNYILPGPNTTVETVPNGDDMLGQVIVAGVDGIAHSGLGGTDIRSSLFKLGSKGYTRSGVPSTWGEPNRIAVHVGLDGRINTPCVFDDNLIRNKGNSDLEFTSLIDGIYSGVDGVVRSGLGGDDFQVYRAGSTVTPFSLLVLPGADGLLETFARGRSDFEILAPGTWTSAANTPIINAGFDGVLDTCPSGDDVIRIDGTTKLPNLVIEAGPNLIAETSISGDDMYAALDGGDGLVHSGLGGDDVQIISASIFMPQGFTLPVVAGGPNKILETPLQGDEAPAIYNLEWAPNGGPISDCFETVPPVDESICAIAESGIGGDDLQVVRGGTAGLLPTDIVVTDGGNATLDTLALGDDVVVGTDILAGPNGISESGIWGDDIQVARRGQSAFLALDMDGDTALDVAVPFPVVLAGPNGVVDTPAGAGDDPVIVEYGFFNDALFEWFIVILYGLDTDGDGIPDPMDIDGDDVIDFADNVPDPGNIPDGWLNDGDSLASSGLGGRGILDVFVGCSATGELDNGGLFMVDDPFVGNPPISECKPRYDDVQLIVPGGSCASDTEPLISAGNDGLLQTPLNPGSDDTFSADGNYILCGANMVSESSIIAPRCGDDCQVTPEGSVIGQNTPIIIAGANRIFDTALLGDDGQRLAIVDGGNGRAESGIGGDDVQTIPAGRGLPKTVGVIAGPSLDGSPRILYTYPGGDDNIFDPGTLFPVLSGADGIFHKDNELTLSDPDGDGRIENYGTVDDGEYFSWQDTNIDTTFLPPFQGEAVGGDVVDDVQVLSWGIACAPGSQVVLPGPNGRLETTPVNMEYLDATGTEILCGGGTVSSIVDNRAVMSFRVLNSSADPAQLIAYMGNGKDIYLTRTMDGITWDAPELVLARGGIGTPESPVVTTGMDGICETTAQGDDIQAVLPGLGLANRPAIGAGANKVLNSVPLGDDYAFGYLIFTGPNGIRETQILGDDWQFIPLGRGEADAPCVIAGTNGRRDTSDAAIGAAKCSDNPTDAIMRYCSTDEDEAIDLPDPVIGDDRAPFVDRDGNLANLARNSASYDPNCNPLAAANYGAECPWRSEANERGVANGGWAGFDALGVNDPYVFAWEGVYYMYYTGVGAAIEPMPARPTAAALEVFGACTRAGINNNMRAEVVTDIRNADDNGSVVVANRIGVATSLDGVNWTKYPQPALGLSSICGSALDLSLLGGLIGDIGIALIMPGASKFDYAGTASPIVSAQYGADGSSVFAMLYTGQAENFTTLAANGRANYGNQKNGVGLARSWDGITWTKMDDFSPVFGGGGLGGLLSLSTDVIINDEGYGTVQAIPDAFVMYYVDAKKTYGPDLLYKEDISAIAVGVRGGAVYGSCMSVAATPFKSQADIGSAIVFGALILLPGLFLIGRRFVARRRRRYEA